MQLRSARSNQIGKAAINDPYQRKLRGHISPLKSTQAKFSVLCSFSPQHLPIAANKPTSLAVLKSKVTETADIASGINLSYYPSFSS